MARTSLAEFLPAFLDRGRDVAYVQPQGYRTVRWSYRRIAETSFQFARELEARAIAKGDRVLLWGPGSAEWVTAFFACALRGVVVVPIDDGAAEEFTRRVHQQVSAKLLLSSRSHAPQIDSAIRLEELPEVVARHSPSPYSSVRIDPQYALEIVFTSGTTADPKGVVITHANVLANIAPLESEMQKYLRYERLVHPVRFLNLLPLSHVFGQFLGIFLPQLLGGTVIFQDALQPSAVISTIRRERVSVLVSVPRVLQALKEKIEQDASQECRLQEFHKIFRQSKDQHFLLRWWTFRIIRRQFGWKFWAFISGGATLDRETEEFWSRLGYAVIQGYGLTETTSLVSVNHPFHLGKGSIGKVLTGREVKLAPDGEILVRGAGVASSYWNGTALTPATGEDAWYHTGDLGELDAEGHLYFKGRKKEVIVTPSGLNIYPEDLEAALRLQPDVRDAVVIASPRNGNAEPCAVLILRPAADPGLVVQQANQSLAEYQRLNSWVVWPDTDFPRTSTHKPRRNQIQKMALEQMGRNSPGHASSGSLSELIARITGRPPAPLPATASLESDLNLSSLDRVALLGALEDQYQLELSESRFSAISSVADLERMLVRQPPAPARFHYPRWVQRWPVTWIRFVVHYLLLRPAVLLLGWPRVEGRRNLDGIRGPALVVCNHIGDVDPGFVLTALPARFRHRLAVATGGEALEILRTPLPTRAWFARIYDRVRWTLGVSLLNLFPLPREAGFRRSFAYAGESVDRGYSILVFPEGHHTTSGQLRPFRDGVGLLVVNLGIPVVPMRIDGLFEIKQAGKKMAWPGQISVKVGLPVTFDPDSDPHSIAQELRNKILAL